MAQAPALDGRGLMGAVIIEHQAQLQFITPASSRDEQIDGAMAQ